MCALVTGVQTCALPIYHGVTILCVAVATAMIGFLMSGVLRRMTGVDHATAFLASMPGGPVEMANLARQYGGDPGPVVFEIGRASCRERVCQYVSISGVVVSLKKKKEEKKTITKN